jgi:chromate reductase
MTMTLRVAAVPGSLRAGSLNRASLRAAGELAPEGMEIEIHGLDGIPLFNADDERDHGAPPPVRRLRESIRAADALLIATPEYNYSIPGVLKNAIDWLSRGPDSPLDLKPAAILGAGGRFGTLRAQLHLREVLLHNRVDLVDSPFVMIDSAASRFDGDLRLSEDRYRRQIGQLLDALAAKVGDRRPSAGSR